MGALISHKLKVEQPKIQAYAELTEDWNPIHLDEEFAKSTPMGGIIAHGTMSLNLIWQSLTTTLGLESLKEARLEIRFTKPVRIDDVLTSHGTATDDGYDVWVENQAGDKVIAGTVILAS